MNQLIGYLSEGEQLKGSLTIPQKIGGGGGGNLQDKTVNITPTESAQSQTVTADPGYDGLNEVDVNVGAISGSYVGSQVPRKSSSDLTQSGGTITAPAGYYQSAASKTIPDAVISEIWAEAQIDTSTHSASIVHGFDIGTSGHIRIGEYAGDPITVEASDLVSGTKSITSNGTGIDVANFATADVAVPNSYTSSDEGKVVDNGELVAQTSTTFTQNGTYDTTTNNEVVVNVSGGNPNENIDKFMNGTLEAYHSDVTALHSDAFRGSTVRTLVLTSLSSFSAQRVMGNAGLYTVDLSGTFTNFPQNTFNGSSGLKTLIIRRPERVSMSATNAFTSTPFASGGTGGTLYVPNSLISDYTSNTNWGTILGYTNNQIKSIESTHTDPDAAIDLTLYYADGTPLPT